MPTPGSRPPERKRSSPPSWWPQVINWPRTTTILALGFLAGNLLYVPMVAMIGSYVPPHFNESVLLVASLFKDGMLIILGFYFGRNMPAERAE